MARRVECGVVGYRLGGVVIELDHRLAGGGGEKVRVQRWTVVADDAELQVLGIPARDGDRIGDIEGDMFEFHGWHSEKRTAVGGQRSVGGLPSWT